MTFNKQKLLDLAEVYDACRVVPQSLLYAYAIFGGSFIVKVTHWYMSLPAAERTAEVTAMVIGVISAISGFGTLAFKLYVQSGRSWDGKVKSDL